MASFVLIAAVLRKASTRAEALSWRLHIGGKGTEKPGTGEKRPSPPRAATVAKYFVEIAVTAAAYFLAARLGLAVPFTSGNVSPMWPAAGVAVSVLLMLGYRVWPGIAAGAFLANFFTPIPHLAALGIGLGNTAGPLAGAWLLRRVAGFQAPNLRLRDVLALIVFAALGGTAISATIGATVLFLTGVNPWSHFLVAWLVWWLGDGLGVIVVAPLLLTFSKLIATRKDRHVLELASLLLGTAITCLLIFDSRVGIGDGKDVLVIAMIPFALWAAIRFGLAGAAAVNVLIAALAVWETAHGFGPLVKQSALGSATLLQVFLGSIAVSDITLAAAVTDSAQRTREEAAREAIQQSDRRYGGILETANEGICMLDAHFTIRFLNGRMADLLGYAVEEMTGKTIFDFLFPEDVDKKKADLERQGHGISDHRYRKKDGSELWVRVSTAPIFSQDGKFEGAVKWLSDLTEANRSETERRSALETVMLLSRAVQQTAESVLITDKTGVIQYVNPAFEAITGYTQDEALGKTPRIVKSGMHGTDFYRKLWDCISAGEPFRGTLLNRKKTGELYWCEQSITPITDNEGNTTHYVSVVRDITDSRKKQEQEVQLLLAREVQQRFYKTEVSVPGLEIAAAAYPADETGGDYFDFISMPDNSLYIAIGDVSGHGLASALVMALTRAYVRSFAELRLGVGDILTRVNRMLRADLENERFATAMLIHIAPDHDSLTYASAGHFPGLLLNSDGSVEYRMGNTGFPLGLFDQYEISVTEIPLKPYQTLLLLTDGVAETAAADDREFGKDGIVEYMRHHCKDCAAEIVHGTYRAARAFAGSEPQQDDCTLVAVKINPWRDRPALRA